MSDNSIIVAGSLSSEALERLQKVMRSSKASNTLKAYKDDFEVFAAWCASEGQKPMPAEGTVLAAFLAWYADTHKASSVARRLAGILWCHKTAGFPGLGDHQAVKMAMEGIQRAHGTRPTRKVPIVGLTLQRMLYSLAGVPAPPLLKQRDRTLMLMGYSGAFRREALCALNVEDLTLHPDRLDVLIRKDKNDQTGKGRIISAQRRPTSPDCAVHALTAWLAKTGIQAGPVFRSVTRHGAASTDRLDSQTVARVVKKAAVAAVFDPAGFSGHSLRAGHITEAARQGARLDQIMRISGHKSADMLLRYIRDADPLSGTSAAKIWVNGPALATVTQDAELDALLDELDEDEL